MRIMTYNIRGWRRLDDRPNLDGVVQVISDLRVDIVGLNEVFYPRGWPGTAAPALAELAQRVGMHFVFGPCLRWPATDLLPADAYGNALLSRWPILASAAHHLTPVEGKEQRGLLEARILLSGGRPLTVYVTHLDHTDEETRLTQLQAVRSWTVRDRSRPHLVLGDFNAVSLWDLAERAAAVTTQPTVAHMAADLGGGERGSRVIAQMEKAGYVDLYRQRGVPGQSTFLLSQEPIRIDYIFATSALAAQLHGCWIPVEVEQLGVSDHLPVVADFVGVHESL